MSSQDTKSLAEAPKILRKSCHQPKKSVKWDSNVVNNHGKSRLVKEIRQLKRKDHKFGREYDRLKALNIQIARGEIPEEYRAKGFTALSAAYVELLARMELLTIRRFLCHCDINIRKLKLKLFKPLPSLQT